MSEQQSEQPGTALAERKPAVPVPLYNGVMSPDRWAMLGRISVTVANTEFVPKSLRGKPDAVMACLLYGDSLGLHPSVSLTDVYVANGRPGVSGALMLAKIREAGHKIKWERLDNGNGEFVGWKCIGERLEDGEVVDSDEWSYTMEDATAAGLYPNADPRAAWMKTPEVMCRWRALSQLGRFLFSDLFRGGSIYTPDEAEEAAYSERIRDGGRQPGTPVENGDEEADYGDDPELAARLIALFAAANEIQAGVWLPKKVRLAVNGKTQAEREKVAAEVEKWIEDHGGEIPDFRPVESTTEEAEFEVMDLANADDEPT
jgi:hypothetical protein